MVKLGRINPCLPQDAIEKSWKPMFLILSLLYSQSSLLGVWTAYLGREKQILYGITYMWTLKYDTNERICETETDSQT